MVFEEVLASSLHGVILGLLRTPPYKFYTSVHTNETLVVILFMNWCFSMLTPTYNFSTRSTIEKD